MEINLLKEKSKEELQIFLGATNRSIDNILNDLYNKFNTDDIINLNNNVIEYLIERVDNLSTIQKYILSISDNREFDNKENCIYMYKSINDKSITINIHYNKFNIDTLLNIINNDYFYNIDVTRLFIKSTIYNNKYNMNKEVVIRVNI